MVFQLEHMYIALLYLLGNANLFGCTRVKKIALTYSFWLSEDLGRELLLFKSCTKSNEQSLKSEVLIMENIIMECISFSTNQSVEKGQ